MADSLPLPLFFDNQRFWNVDVGQWNRMSGENLKSLAITID